VLVALTGGTGFVGRHVIAALLERGHRVRALARDPRRLSATPDVEAVTADLANRAALDALVAGAGAVVHLVGIIVESGRQTFQAVHVDGTKRLLDAALAHRVPRFVHMSAVGARIDPHATRYHQTKGAAEDLVRRSGLAAAILRPSIINGPGNAPIRTLARMHRWSPFVPIFGSGRFPMQPVWIDDVAHAFALAVERTALSGTFELGGPARVTYAELVTAIGRACGHPRPLVHVPLALVRLAARACDPLGAAAPITSDQLRMLVEGSATPENAIERVFGISPLALEAGLARFLTPA